MSTGVQHLSSQAAQLLSSSDEEKIRFIKQSKWIGYDRAHQILDRLEDLLDHPKQARMPNMLLVGPTNNGKTHLIHQFAQKHRADENPTGDHIIAPVICCEAPPVPSEAGFYAEILNVLFERVPPSSTEAKRRRVIEVLGKVQTKVLIIDELHNVLAGSSVKQQNFFNMIKYLSNQLRISIVGCGTGDLVRAVAIDTQIQNRFIPEVLPVWKKDTQLRRLLASMESMIPLPEPSSLHHSDTASLVLALSGGTIGEMSMLVEAAAIYAIRKGFSRIDERVLRECSYLPPEHRKAAALKI